MSFAENSLELELVGFEDTIMPGDSIVGWVLWKDEYTEMVVLGDEEDQPHLFTSYSAAKWGRDLLDVIAPVTQQRYDELCGKKVVIAEVAPPMKDGPVKDGKEEWMQSMLAKIGKVVAKTPEARAKGLGVTPEEVVELSPAAQKEVVKPAPMPFRRVAKRRDPLQGNVDGKGFVYLLRAPLAPGVYKIGRSDDPERRLKDIQCMSPIGIALECVKPTNDMGRVEALLHSRFDSKRKHGEWFWLTEEDVEWIKKIDVSNAMSLHNVPWTKWLELP